MLRAGAILASALALTAATALSGIDRMARTDPAIAAKVPAPFAHAAFGTLGTAALAGGRSRDLAAYGWHALDRTPFEAQSVALFAAGQIAQGNPAAGDRAFALAGRMGWRVPLTQVYWLDRSLAAGDYDGAAMRIDALLRQMPSLVGQQALLDRVERNPAARAALLDRIDPATVWLGKYLNEVFGLSPRVLRQRSVMLVEAAQRGLVLGCGPVASLTGALVNAGLYTEADLVRRAQCPGATGLLSGGEDFATLDRNGSADPYAWKAIGSGDVALALEPVRGGAGKRLSVSGTPATTRPFLAKLLQLAPGRYRLDWAGSDDGTGLKAALTCPGKPPQWLALTARANRQGADMKIEPGCFPQLITFALAAGGGTLTLESVRLSPLQ